MADTIHPDPARPDDGATPAFMAVDMRDGVVHTGASEHPEPLPGPGEIAPAWNRCTIPGCTHSPPCPAKLRAWAGYGRRYICTHPGCRHRACRARRLAREDGQPFGEPYDGPALPQHVVGRDGRPLGPPMVALKDVDGRWRLVPRGTNGVADGRGFSSSARAPGR